MAYGNHTLIFAVRVVYFNTGYILASLLFHLSEINSASLLDTIDCKY